MALPKQVANLALGYKKRLDRARVAYYRGELDGYCHHGVYVGGCGIDYMCHNCESGYSNYEVALMAAWEEARRIRTYHAHKLFETVLGSHMEVFDYMDKVQTQQFVASLTYLQGSLEG